MLEIQPKEVAFKQVKTVKKVKEPKKREPKKKPTKEESLKLLSEASNELQHIMKELKEEELKIASIPLKRIPELLNETYNNLKEDIEELDAKSKELLAIP